MNPYTAGFFVGLGCFFLIGIMMRHYCLGMVPSGVVPLSVALGIALGYQKGWVPYITAFGFLAIVVAYYLGWFSHYLKEEGWDTMSRWRCRHRFR